MQTTEKPGPRWRYALETIRETGDGWYPPQEVWTPIDDVKCQHPIIHAITLVSQKNERVMEMSELLCSIHLHQSIQKHIHLRSRRSPWRVSRWAPQILSEVAMTRPVPQLLFNCPLFEDACLSSVPPTVWLISSMTKAYLCPSVCFYKNVDWKGLSVI